MVRQFFTNGERDERGTRGPVVTASGATTTVLFEAMRFRNAIDTFQYASPVQCGAAVVVSASKGASKWYSEDGTSSRVNQINTASAGPDAWAFCAAGIGE
eukprot:m.715654 g.715654  ORF g.715654 m.715654 type:complete len:100 (+) comp22980_c1_seq10:3170-3469(+)